VLSSDIPVQQFHFPCPRPTGQWLQGRGQSRIQGFEQSCLGGQGHDQLLVTPQHELRPGEELHDTRQSRHGRTSAALATPQPPSLIGRVVCTHAAWDAGVPTTASHMARWVAAMSAAKTAV